MSIIWPALSLKLSVPRRITDNLTWDKQVNEQCAKASRLLGYVRRNTRLVRSITVRHSAYLTLVRSHLDYATQVWTPQSIGLIRGLERVPRRATKYILDVPFICDRTYGDRLINFNLLPISYWHGFLDMYKYNVDQPYNVTTTQRTHTQWKKTVKNITIWHKTLSASAAKVNKFQNACCINFPHELTCQILTNQSIKIGSSVWPTLDLGAKATGMSFLPVNTGWILASEVSLKSKF